MLTAFLPGLPLGAREPQIALDQSGAVYIAFGAENAVYGSASRDGGRIFSPPVKVAQVGSLSLGMRRGPRIAVAKNTVVVTAVYGREGKGQDGELFAWLSKDGGTTWRGPVTVNDVPGASREGLHAMAAAPNGLLACAWLDLRTPRTTIYAAFSSDGGATWSKNVLVYASPDGSVCECCHPSLTFTPDNHLIVMWRNLISGKRDLYFSRTADRGCSFTPAVRLGQGTWPLNACPMDGGGVAIEASGRLVTFWRREDDMFLCTPGQAERRIDRGQQGWLAAGSGGVYAVYLSGGRPGTVMAILPNTTKPVFVARDANDPVVAAQKNGPAIAAWTSGRKPGETAICTAVLSRK